MPLDLDPPECLACGVCCFSALPQYVPVTGDDYARLDDAAAAALVVWEENRAYMRIEDGHCAALRLDAEARRFVCTIYEARPATCRALERGSAQCEGERATKGERPLVALRRRTDADARSGNLRPKSR
jgi:Fe-S-cluster containining protein